MEKEPQPDSMATITIKPEYPPSEVYSSEPPPAYHRSQSSAVQVAKIIAVTVVLVSVVLGSFILASAYVTATASCRQLEQELELLNEAADRFQSPLPPEALVQEEPQKHKQNTDSLHTEESRKQINEIKNNNVDSTDSENSEDSESSSSSSDSSTSDESDEKPIFIKLPLQLDFDDLAGALIEKNQKSRMNCVVEKKRAEEIVDHKPKTLNLPFGLNLTTDPRYERISGERMAIFCESGNEQKQSPQEDEQDEETIMIQPVMIPIPQTHFPTHMAQQLRPITPHQQPYPVDSLRPPMPPQVQQVEGRNQLPPNQVLHQIAQEIIAQKIMEAQRAREEQNQEMRPNADQTQQFSAPEQMVAQKIPIPEEVLSQLNRLPNRDVIVTVSQQEFEDEPQESREGQVETQEINGVPQGVKILAQEMNAVPQQMRVVPQQMREIVQDVRTPPQMMMPAQPEMRNVVAPEANLAPPEMRNVPPPVAEAMQEMKVYQQQRQNAQEMNGRQSYGRVLPIHIPVHMIQQGQAEPRAVATEESRPHYVQPRSVRSVDALISKSEKRVKRCSCDCAC